MYKIRALFVCCLLLLAVALCCVSCAKSTEAAWWEQYDLGVRYLESGDYEQAVLAFTAAIEIDPNRAEAYQQIVDTLLEQNDVAGALEYAKRGAESTGNEELIQRAEELGQRAVVELCEHDWIPATLDQPETCLNCGTTRGEPVVTYFSENGLEYVDTFLEATIPINYVTYNKKDPTDFFVSDQGEFSMTQSVQNADEQGYKKVILTAIRRTPIEYRVSEDEFPYARAQMNVQSSRALYDVYTGHIIVGQETFQSEDGYGVLRGYEASIELNGEAIPIRYTVETSWESEGWTTNERNGYHILLGMTVDTYTFILPLEYDGLLFALMPTFDYPDDIFEEPFFDPGSSVMNLREDILAETVFIQLGQGTPLE